jgi:SSS family solute:Na+ symporter
MLTKRVPAIAAKFGLIVGFALIAIGYFVPPFDKVVASLHEFHFLGIVFSWLMILMLVIGEIRPRETEFHQEDVGAVDMTPWKHARAAGIVLIILIFAIYITFADFSVLTP